MTSKIDIIAILVTLLVAGLSGLLYLSTTLAVMETKIDQIVQVEPRVRELDVTVGVLVERVTSLEETFGDHFTQNKTAGIDFNNPSLHGVRYIR